MRSHISIETRTSRKKYLGLASFLIGGLICQTAPAFADDWEEQLSDAQGKLKQGHLEEAESAFKQAEKSCEEVKLGPTDGDGFKRISKGVADCLIGLATIRDRQGDTSESDRLYELAIRTVEKAYTSNSLDYAKYLPPLADLYDKHGKADKAELVLKKVIDTRLALKDDNANVAQAYDHYARYLRAKSQPDKATEYENKSAELKYKLQN
ncbi:MAG: tetratricopeptide repeat protein [Candidatus Obscuribacterales bacterium]|jgi:hypothetical protein|nr:tetratricopeptide repeat protein [Candidatus Obscuribacterales bacterium]